MPGKESTLFRDSTCARCCIPQACYRQSTAYRLLVRVLLRQPQATYTRLIIFMCCTEQVQTASNVVTDG